MDEKPIIEIEATFLASEQGGRLLMPDLMIGRYMPHLVVQPPEVRAAVMEGNILVEDYLGVAFVAGPEPLIAGQSGRFSIELMYHPGVNYQAIEEGATFTIREGAKVVGYGKVVRNPDVSKTTHSTESGRGKWAQFEEALAEVADVEPEERDRL